MKEPTNGLRGILTIVAGSIIVALVLGLISAMGDIKVHADRLNHADDERTEIKTNVKDGIINIHKSLGTIALKVAEIGATQRAIKESITRLEDK